MNDVTLTELKIVVERAVRPVRATVYSKRKMREELLAHLVSIFAEEMQEAGDEHAALDQVKRRFGDPRELTGELQQAVSQWDRFLYFIENFICFRAGESMLLHAARVAVLPYMWSAITCLLVLAVLLIRGRQYEIGRVMFGFLAASVVVSGIVFVLTFLAHGLRNALYCDTSRRSIPLAIVLGLLAALLLPVGGFVLSWTASSDVALGYAHFCFLCWFSLVVPVLLLLIAKGIDKGTSIDAEDGLPRQHTEE
jgi:hypothetical protein